MSYGLLKEWSEGREERGKWEKREVCYGVLKEWAEGRQGRGEWEKRELCYGVLKEWFEGSGMKWKESVEKSRREEWLEMRGMCEARARI